MLNQYFEHATAAILHEGGTSCSSSATR